MRWNVKQRDLCRCPTKIHGDVKRQPLFEGKWAMKKDMFGLYRELHYAVIGLPWDIIIIRTSMSQDVSRWFVNGLSPQYTPSPIYEPFPNFQRDIHVWTQLNISFNAKRTWFSGCSGFFESFQADVLYRQGPKSKPFTYCLWFSNPKQPPGIHKTCLTNSINPVDMEECPHFSHGFVFRRYQGEVPVVHH